MPDNRPLNINMNTVARFAAGGALGGAATASALNLVHMLREMNEKRKNPEVPSQTDENTIVLTLPRRKQAAVEAETKPPTKVAKTSTRTVVKPATAKKQVKHYDGQFGRSVKDQEKKANWQTLAAAMLAMGGAGTLGYMVADKVYNNRRMKQKEKELQESRQEYLDMISRNATKTAQDTGRSFNTLDYPLGAAALALLVGGGTTAWLTKRILDEYAMEHSKPKGIRPEVKRIVFKSASEMEDGSMDKDASDMSQALVSVYMDIMSGQSSVLGDPDCQTQLKAAGVTADDMYKMAAGPSDDYYSLIATLDANPELRKVLQRVSMEKHPVLKHFRWAVGLPGIRGYADKKLYGGVENMYNSPDRAASLGKMAAMLPMSGLVGGLTGSAIMGSAMESGRVEQKLEELMEAIKQEKAEKEEQDEDRSIDIVAADPGAAEFVGRNHDKIRTALAALDQSNKI